jgi:hypothetical protein
MNRALAAMVFAAAVRAETASEFFEKRIRPLLAEKCLSCHSSNTRSSLLALDSKGGIDAGGKRGAVLVAGDPDASLLIRAVSYQGDLKMPPEGRLAAGAIEDLREWIRQGAPYPEPAAAPSVDWDRAREHWSFRPVVKPGAPRIANTGWPRTEIDAFLLSRMEKESLTPAPPASKRDLIRRATFDLTGLPPTPAEVAAFLRDPAVDAFERVIERLLCSPHYGERWARHWLDVVRFAETNGHEFDFYKYEAWRYRDYVIRAFDQDLPYNRFLAEHVAGDLLSAKRIAPSGLHWESPIGTGFFGLQEERNGATDLEEVRTEMRDSKIDVFGKAFLGLTIACARCHDHKFDPIPTTDYYALGGIVDSTRTSLGSIESPEVASKIERLLAPTARPERARPTRPELRPGDELFEDFGESKLSNWHSSGAAFRGERGTVLDTSRRASNRFTGIMISKSFVPRRKYIHVRLAGTKFAPVREFPSLLAVTIFAPGRYPKGVAGEGDRKLRWKTIPLKEEVGQVCHLEIADRQVDGHIAVQAIVFSDHKEPPRNSDDELDAVVPIPDERLLPEETFGRVSYEDVPHDMRIHVRGNHLVTGDVAARGFLRILGKSGPEYREGSGRLALADAMTDPANPLVARVMVNRIWKHHFGEGLVGTVDNFGRMGERPSHPELLDWLAARFVESGWSVKSMHRLILGSTAYRMSTAASEAAAARDPRNRLLTHMPVRRLEAEAIRDSILAVSGSLVPVTQGPSVTPHISAFQDGRGKPEPGPLDGNGRRSIYIEVRRNFLTPLLTAFDMPLPTTAVGRRSVSTVPAQALALMNNELVGTEASKWAKRMTAEFHDPSERLSEMYQRAFGRPPEESERQMVTEFLQKGGSWGEVAHVLFNAKEFLFVR